jgi:hypothetical protein
MEDSKRNTVELLVGFAILALIGYAVYWVGAAGSRWLWPTQESVAALSAHFDNSKLQIAGHMHCGGKPATGKAKVTVRTIDWAFRQSVMADLKDGRFEIRDAPEFRTLQSKDQVHVSADFTINGTLAAIEEIYLNTPVAHSLGQRLDYPFTHRTRRDQHFLLGVYRSRFAQEESRGTDLFVLRDLRRSRVAPDGAARDRADVSRAPGLDEQRRRRYRDYETARHRHGH